MIEKLLKKSGVGAGIGLLVGALILLIMWRMPPPELANVETILLDLYFSLKVEFLQEQQQQGINIDDIIIIESDDQSTEKLGPFSEWPRSYHARIIDYLRESEAACIAFDILFMKKPNAKSAEDSLFILSTRNANNVIHSLAFSSTGEKPPEGFTSERFTVSLPREIVAAFDTMYMYYSLYGNMVELCNNSAAVGFINVFPDEDDVIRKMPLFVNFANQLYPSFALAVVMHVAGITRNDIEIELGREARLGKLTPTRQPLRIPIDDSGRVLINYMGPRKTFRYVSFNDVLDQRLPPEMFKNRVVLIGGPSSSNLLTVPFQHGFPGIEIEANIIHNILNQKFIVQSTALSVASMLVVAMIIGVITMLLSPWLGIVLLIVLEVLYSVSSVWVFVHRNFWLPEVLPLLTFGVVLLCVNWYRFLNDEHKIYQIDDSKLVNFRGVKGWLFFFCLILFVLSPIGTLIKLITIASSEIKPLFVGYPLYVIDLILSIALIGFGIYSGIALWEVKPNAVAIARMYLLFSLAYSMLFPFLFLYAKIPSNATKIFWIEIIRGIISGLGFFGIWYTYLNRSKRVRATYFSPALSNSNV